MKVLLMAFLAAAGILVAAEPNVGEKYESRNPFVCASKKEPANGAPSVNRLKDLVRCGTGGERVTSQMLYLLENLKVEVGKGRPYQASDRQSQNIDPSLPVYPIRGSYDRYQCAVVNNAIDLKAYKSGANCSVYPNPEATGVCYKTTFGDWNCVMSDFMIGSSSKREYVAPPK
jgi:hypothetical protein